MTNDFYCDFVLNNKIEVNIIYENTDILVYEHTRPSWCVHYVLTPKCHIDDLYSCNSEMLNAILKAIKIISKQVVNQHGACRVLTNFGEYQESKHLHWHLYVE